MNNPEVSKRQLAWGNGLIRFCVFVMAAGSLLKFLHPARIAAYMDSLGYRDDALLFVACLELLCALLFAFRSTRSIGLLFVSSYFGGAIAAHVASHPHVSGLPAVAGGPFLMFMANHPYIGSLEPGLVLAAAWIGAWLCDPSMVLGSASSRKAEQDGVVAAARVRIAMGSGLSSAK